MADATAVTSVGIYKTLAEAAGAGEVQQLADGRAGVMAGNRAAASGGRERFTTAGQWVVTKTAGIEILDGGRVYWDYSANAATFRKVNDRDFYLGRAVGNASSAATSLTVDLNIDPPDDLDLARDPFTTAIVGTQALGGLGLLRRGGAHHLILDATNEAQKVDCLGVDGFATGANAIVELAFRVISDGAGAAPDMSLGVANGTHASDADAITESVLIHLDGNATAIKAESDDGTVEVAATDTAKVYAEGAAVTNRVEVWIDFRNPADVQMYVDGVNVLPNSVFNVSVAVGPWRLLAHAEKTAATDAYELAVDWARARFAEQ